MFWRAFLRNISAQMSLLFSNVTLLVFIFINNIIFIYGSTVFFFAGKEQEQMYSFYYLMLVAICFGSFGLISMFGAGLRKIPHWIETGYFERFMALPRRELWVAAISESDPTGITDTFASFVLLVIVALFLSPLKALWALFFILSATVTFIGVECFLGALCFWARKPHGIIDTINMLILIGSNYPSGLFLKGTTRSVMYLTPIGALSILPLEYIFEGNIFVLLGCLLVSFFWLFLGILFFRWSQKRYQGGNYSLLM